MSSPGAPAVAPGGGLLEKPEIATLLLGNVLVAVGVGFWLPILPLFVGSKGGSALLVGAVFSAGLLAKGIFQYPGGWAADRFGRRPVIVVSIALYAVFFLFYLLPVPAWGLIVIRFVHASVVAAYGPAASAMLADLTSPSERGRAFGWFRASDMAGTVFGPALGGLVAGLRLSDVFIAGGAVCAVSALLMLRLPRVHPLSEVGLEPPRHPARILSTLLPVIALGSAAAYTIGTYDTVWSLYMTHWGASTIVVGLSFTAFAVPIVLLGGVAGGLSDRHPARLVAAVSIAFYGIFGGSYGFISNVPVLVSMGIVEGAFIAAGQPALSAEVSRSASSSEQGRTQGLYQTALIVPNIVGAIAGGALYVLHPAFAFFGIAVFCLLAIAAGLYLGRSRPAVSVQP